MQNVWSLSELMILMSTFISYCEGRVLILFFPSRLRLLNHRSSLQGVCAICMSEGSDFLIRSTKYEALRGNFAYYLYSAVGNELSQLRELAWASAPHPGRDSSGIFAARSRVLLPAESEEPLPPTSLRKGLTYSSLGSVSGRYTVGSKTAVTGLGI